MAPTGSPATDGEVPAARRKPGRPAATSSGDTKAQILDVALDAFAAGGFDATSTRDIAAGAGVTIATIYHHFGSKRGLYNETYAHAIDTAWTAYADAAGGRSSLLEELTVIFERSLDVMRTYPAITRLALYGQTDPEHLAGQALRAPPATRDIIDSMIARAVDRGELDVADTRIFTIVLTAMQWGLSVVGLNDDAARRDCVIGFQRLLAHTLISPAPDAPPPADDPAPA
jgi:AcrR family transcriptional regulator